MHMCVRAWPLIVLYFLVPVASNDRRTVWSWRWNLWSSCQCQKKPRKNSSLDQECNKWSCSGNCCLTPCMLCNARRHITYMKVQNFKSFVSLDRIFTASHFGFVTLAEGKISCLFRKKERIIRYVDQFLSLNPSRPLAIQLLSSLVK